MSAAGLQVCGAGAWKTRMMALHSFHLTQHGHSLVPQHTLADVRPRTRDSMGARLSQRLPAAGQLLMVGICLTSVLVQDTTGRQESGP